MGFPFACDADKNEVIAGVWSAPRTVAWSEARGFRESMEDTILVCNALRGDPRYQLYCVFDGHRGSSVAEFLAQTTDKVIGRFLLKFPELSVAEIIKRSFAYLEKKIVQKDLKSGSTAVIGLFSEKRMYFANVGDARTVLCRNGKAVRVSFDHKGTCKAERKRIEALGGYVSDRGRVMGDIAVSRSFGDTIAEPYITSEPFFSEYEITEQDEFVILACDGLWDEVTDEQAVELTKTFLHKGGAPSKAALMLRDFALLHGSGDNISVIVIFFREY